MIGTNVVYRFFQRFAGPILSESNGGNIMAIKAVSKVRADDPTTDLSTKDASTVAEPTPVAMTSPETSTDTKDTSVVKVKADDPLPAS
jgi:hypothetical protein